LERGTERNLTGGESLDQDHWTATDWTSPHRNWLGGDRCASGCRSGRYIGQELFAKRHEFTPPATAQETVVADANESARQHMKEKSTQELINGQRHEAFFILVSGVSPTDSNLISDE
jgi:hypothetical protein